MGTGAKVRIKKNPAAMINKKCHGFSHHDTTYNIV